MPSKLLIADDDPLIRRMVAETLRAADFVVFEAGNGREAIDAIEEHRPQLIITDWLMPQMDGLELTRALRRMQDDIGWVYIVMLTALGDTERLVEAFEVGADDYLVKPFHPAELTARVRAGDRMVRLKMNLARQERELHRRNAQLEVAYHELTVANERLDEMATTDELTGLRNRRAAMTQIERRWDEVSRNGGAMSLVLIDIDHFKTFNDTYGHEIGDLVLKHTAQTLSSTTRSSEEVFRFGGEEFMLICTHATAQDAEIAAERLRSHVDEMRVHHNGQDMRVAVSLGVAERRPWMTELKELIKSADEALYAAKHGGRNQVKVADALQSTGFGMADTTPDETPAEDDVDSIKGNFDLSEAAEDAKIRRGA